MIKKIQGILRKKAPAIVVSYKAIGAWLKRPQKKLSSHDCIDCFKNIPICTPEIYDAIFNKLNSQEEVKFIQIGANDGKTHDPIHAFVSPSKKWQGIVVEPVEYIFNLLLKNYENRSDLIFENVAISDSNKDKKFFYVSNEAVKQIKGLKNNYNGVNGFSYDHIVRHFGEKIKPFIKEQVMRTITLNTLLRRNNIQSLDILLIDVEGHEYSILKQLNFSEIKPKVILIEHQNASYKNTFKMILKLKPHYTIFRSGGDLMAIIPSFTPLLNSERNRK
ncbi:MAG: FkbM family methyltransferase [Verrucomicrobiota bacterium]